MVHSPFPAIKRVTPPPADRSTGMSSGCTVPAGPRGKAKKRGSENSQGKCSGDATQRQCFVEKAAVTHGDSIILVAKAVVTQRKGSDVAAKALILPQHGTGGFAPQAGRSIFMLE